MPIEFIPESMQRLCAPAARARRCESRSSITRIVLESAVVGILATVCVAWWQVWTVDLSAPPGSQFGARAGWTVATRTEGSCVSILSNATGPQAQQAAAVLLPSWSIANRAVDPADLGSFDPRSARSLRFQDCSLARSMWKKRAVGRWRVCFRGIQHNDPLRTMLESA